MSGSVRKGSGKPVDRWTTWFFRLVQVAGLGGFLHELVLGGSDERPWILLVACAMTLGAYGVELIVRALPNGR